MNSYTKEIVHMNDNERKDVHELTNEELVCEIALATGTVSHCFEITHTVHGTKSWFLKRGDQEYTANTLRTVLYKAEVPNWPEDDGAAFRLVLEVLGDLNARAHEEKAISVHSTWEFRITNDGANYTQFGFLFGHEWDSYEVEGTDARALSELAALALRQMGGE